MQTTVRPDDLKAQASEGVGAFEGDQTRQIPEAVALEVWLNVINVGAAGTVTVNVRTSYLDSPDISDPNDWHIIGTFSAIAAVGIPTPLAFARGTDPLGKHVSVIGSVGVNAVEFEVVSLMKETL